MRYEFFNCLTGSLFTLTKTKAELMFGVTEFLEMLLGYNPDWVVSKVATRNFLR